MAHHAVALALLGALLTPSSAVAQAVLLRISPPEGQVSTYDFGMDMDMKLGDMGEMNMRTMMRMTQTITAVEGDEHTMLMSIDSIVMNGSPGLPVNGAQMEGTTMNIRMDSRGRQLSTDAPSGLNSPMPGFEGFTQVFLPEEPVAPGAEWADDVPLEFGGESGMRMQKDLTYRFEKLEIVGGARHAHLSVAGSITYSGVPAAGTSELDGTVVLDLDLGRLVSMSMQMNMLMKTPDLGPAITMSMTMEGGLVAQS